MKTMSSRWNTAGFGDGRRRRQRHLPSHRRRRARLSSGSKSGHSSGAPRPNSAANTPTSAGVVRDLGLDLVREHRRPVVGVHRLYKVRIKVKTDDTEDSGSDRCGGGCARSMDRRMVYSQMTRAGALLYRGIIGRSKPRGTDNRGGGSGCNSLITLSLPSRLLIRRAVPRAGLASPQRQAPLNSRRVDVAHGGSFNGGWYCRCDESY